MRSQEVLTWPDESEDESRAEEVAEVKRSLSLRAALSQPTRSRTLGSQMEFPLLSSRTVESWSDVKTALSRRLEGPDPLFWEGILE